MMYWGSGWNAAGGLAMTVGMIAVVALVAAGLVLLIRPVFGRPSSVRYEPNRDSVTPGSGGLEVLEGRYARGEITKEDYLDRRRDLAGQSMWPGSVKSDGAVDRSGKR